MFQYSWRVGGIVAACVCSISFADNTDEPVDELNTVYSAFTPAFDTNPHFATSSVTIITPEQFNASDVTVADVIELSPSVQIQDSGEQGSSQSVSVRGAPSQQTHIYVDGVLQSNVGGSGGYLSQIPLADIERIEIYPSAVPLQFSQASPGGAINIVRRQIDRKQAKVTLEAGSFGHKRGAVSADWRNQNWLAGGYLEAVSADNDFNYLNDNGTPDFTGDDSTQTRNNAEYESLSGSLKVGYQTDDINAHVRFDAADSKKNLPHWNNRNIDDTFYQQADWTLQAGVSANQWLPNLDSSVRWQTNQQDGHFSDPGNNIGISNNDSYDTLTSTQWLHHSAVFLPFGLLAINNELHNDGYALEDDLNGTSLDASRQQFNNSVGVEWFVTDVVTATGALRHVWYEDEQGGDKQQESQIGWQLGARADFEEITLQVNLQQASRQPNLLERFGARGSFEGNDGLISERSHGIDATAQYSTDHIALTSSVFYRTTTDTIAITYNSQGIGRYINLDEATFYGFEWQAVVDLQIVGIDSLQLSTAGSVQQGVSSSPLRAFDNKQVPGFYPISTRQSIDWQATEQLKTSLDYVYESGLYYDRANSTLAPDKHQVDANINWQWQQTRTSFQIKNLLNRQHLDVSRKVLHGISYVITFEYTLGK